MINMGQQKTVIGNRNVLVVLTIPLVVCIVGCHQLSPCFGVLVDVASRVYLVSFRSTVLFARLANRLVSR